MMFIKISLVYEKSFVETQMINKHVIVSFSDTALLHLCAVLVTSLTRWDVEFLWVGEYLCCRYIYL